MCLHFIVFAFCFYFYQISYGEETSNEYSPQYLDNLLSSSKYDDFARIMKINNTHLVDASQRKTSIAGLFFYNGLELGDILLRHGQLLNPDQLNSFDGIITLSINKWENGVVPYYLSKQYAKKERKLIKNEIRKNRQAYAPHIHIRPYRSGDNDFVFIFKGGSGCYSNLGNVGGPQAISLSSPCVFDGTISHQMTHTLGIPHASNRLDREDYVPLIHENIPEILISQYTRYSSENPANIGELDFNSIVFEPPKTLGFGVPSFNITQDGIDLSKVGIQKFLADSDIKRMIQFYS